MHKEAELRTRRSFISHAAQAAALGCCPLPLLAQSRAIRLVSMTDLSGVEKDSGSAIRQGINACVRAFNRGGGVFGSAIEYTPLDHEFSVERTKALTLQIESDVSCLGIVSLAGTAHTSTANDAAPMLPIIGPISGASTLRKKSAPSVFWVRASYEDEVDRLVKHGAALGLRSIGLVHSNDAFGMELLSAFNKTMDALQLAPAVVATTPAFTSSDIQGAVDKAATARPQLLLVALAAMMPPFVKALRSRGVASTIYGLSIGASDANIASLGEQGRGVGFSLVVPAPSSLKYELVRRYQADMQAAGATGLSVFSLEGYISARVAIEGIKRAGASPTRRGLVAGLESLTNLDLGGFRIAYGLGNRIAGSFVEVGVLGAGGRLLI